MNTTSIITAYKRNKQGVIEKYFSYFPPYSAEPDEGKYCMHEFDKLTYREYCHFYSDF